MLFEYAYARSSSVTDRADGTDMSFSPDTSREPTFFKGELRKKISFREAISALHDVVVSDLRFKPKDKTEYMEWRKKQDELNWADIGQQRAAVKERLQKLQAELTELTTKSQKRMSEFYTAKRKYFDYLYQKDRDAWFVLDPVITVHPDEVFFECFSQDEATYGRLGASYEVFQNVGEFSCGTTNVDYSQALYDEFQKIRSYKSTSLEVDPTGFTVEVQNEDEYKEVKIDLPDTWVRGFLQVSSAMSLSATVFDLHPMDVHNMCFVLRRHKEKKGPRGMRYHLTPGEPIKVVFEPWNIEISCPRSIYQGDDRAEIRVWGRRRIHTLERLIPLANKFTVYLLGTGMPSFYVADLGDMSFTLGLSGWTANDWSTAGNFDLMAPRAQVDSVTQRRVFNALKENWREKPDDLAKRLGLDRKIVLGALGAYTQAGRAIFDLDKKVYRVRELSREPLPMDKLRWANEREQAANEMVDERRVTILEKDAVPGGTRIAGSISSRTQNFRPTLVIDPDERMTDAHCSCNWHLMNKLFKGPCEHLLALRIAFNRGLTAPVAEVKKQPQQAPQPQQPKPASNERSIVQTMELVLDRALRDMTDRRMVEVLSHKRERVLEEMLEQSLRASGLDDAIEKALEALMESEFVEEVFASDEDLVRVFQEAFVFVQRTR